MQTPHTEPRPLAKTTHPSGLWYGPAIDWLIDHRRIAVLVVVLISAVLSVVVPRMKADVTLKSGINTDAPQYAQYQEFRKHFGNEEFILIAVSNSDPAKIPAVLTALKAITEELERTDTIVQVLSLANLKVFQERNGRFGSYPLIVQDGGPPRLSDAQRLEKVRKALPFVDLLVSPDGKTFGLMVRMDEQWSFDPPVITKLVERIEAVLAENLPPGSEHRIIGAPVIRKAIQRYNKQTAYTFGLLCLVVATAVSFYIFKSLRTTVITMIVVGLCDLWILGVMAWLGIQINSTTALAFGMVLISSVEPVIHLVTHFNEGYKALGDRVAAAKNALYLGAGPCLITSFTTAFGFSSLIVASVPMVCQLGVILTGGPLIAFVLSVILVPAFLIALKPLPQRVYRSMDSDLLTRGFDRTEGFVLSHHRWFATGLLLLIGIMLSGSPFIRSDTQVMRLLTDKTQEIQDVRFVEEKLAPISSLEIMVEAPDNTFKDPAAWKGVKVLEDRLKEIPEVVSVESLLPLMEYLHHITSGREIASDELFTNPKVIPQLLAMTGLGRDGKFMLARHLDDHSGRLHISVRIKNSPDTTISETIQHVRSIAEGAMNGVGKVIVTGDLAVFEAQASEIVSSQTYSLLLAIGYMTVLLAIQFRSITLGLISLLPQVLPQAVIFGTMGWFGIPLDSVTVFAASVSIGLTVDNTVHYLTQLKRVIRSGADLGNVQECLREAYKVTARAMISNHAVIFFGFAMLLISPFRPVIFFGVLGSLAIFFSLVGDLIFMPSVILSSSLIRRMLTREMISSKTD